MDKNNGTRLRAAVIVFVAIVGGVYVLTNSLLFTDRVNGIVAYLFFVGMMAVLGMKAVSKTDSWVRKYYLEWFIMSAFIICGIFTYACANKIMFLIATILSVSYIVATRIAVWRLERIFDGLFEKFENSRKFIDQVFLVCSITIPIFLILGIIF